MGDGIKDAKTSKWVRGISQCFFPAVVAVTMAGQVPWQSWPLNLCCHFQSLYFSLSVLLVFWFLHERKPIHIAVCVLIAILAGYKLYPYFPQASEGAGSKTTTRLLQINLYVNNRSFDRISACVRSSNADIIACEELNDEIYTGLTTAHTLDAYKGRIVVPNPHRDSEIALFTKLPIRSSSVQYAYGEKDPSIIAQLQTADNKLITVIVMHPRPPVIPVLLARQQNQFRFIAAKRASFGSSLIVMGDLNTTPWSAEFKEFTAAMNLCNPRIGRKVMGSWPYYMPPLRIPIDHILTSPDIRVKKLDLGDFDGSDHLPLLMEF